MTTSGKDSIAKPPGGKDDVANAALGALLLAPLGPVWGITWPGGERVRLDQERHPFDHNRQFFGGDE